MLNQEASAELLAGLYDDTASLIPAEYLSHARLIQSNLESISNLMGSSADLVKNQLELMIRVGHPDFPLPEEQQLMRQVILAKAEQTPGGLPTLIAGLEQAVAED